MSIEHIKALILESLTTEMMDAARELQYEQMINRITFDVRRLNKDIATLFKVGTAEKHTDPDYMSARDIKNYKAKINDVNKKVFSASNIKNVLAGNKDLGITGKGYQIATSINAAITAINRRKQGNTSLISNYAVVEDSGNNKVKIAFIYSYKVRQRTTNNYKKAKDAGDNVLSALKTQAFKEIRQYFAKKKRDVPDSAREGELFKLHGIIDEGVQTTVALTNILDTLFREKKHATIGTQYHEVVTTFIDEISTSFGVKRDREETLEEFLDYFIIDMELGIRGDNTTVGAGKAGHNPKIAHITAADKGKIDKAILRVANKIHKQLGSDYEGSRKPTKVLTGKGTKVIVDRVLDRPRDAKGRFIKVTKANINEKDKKYKEKGEGEKVLLKGSSKTTARTRGKASKLGRTSRGRPRTQESAIKLRALLDRLLPKVVQSKMQEPRLVYRTGRFAQSVRTENVVIGPRGGIHIDYTYMKYPYQTFEPGFAQGSKYRDPRSIIKESIREIAITLVGEKFMTMRRV